MLAWFMPLSCVCLPVRPSVRLSQAGIVSKRLKLGSRTQNRMIAQGLYFSYAKISEILRGDPNRAPYAGRVD